MDNLYNVGDSLEVTDIENHESKREVDGVVSDQAFIGTENLMPNAANGSKSLSYQDVLELIPERYRNAPGLPVPNANGLHVDSSSDSGDQQSVHSHENMQYPEGFLDLLSTYSSFFVSVDSETQKRLEKEEDFSHGMKIGFSR